MFAEAEQSAVPTGAESSTGMITGSGESASSATAVMTMGAVSRDLDSSMCICLSSRRAVRTSTGSKAAAAEVCCGIMDGEGHGLRDTARRGWAYIASGYTW